MNIKLPMANPHGVNDGLIVSVNGAESDKIHLVQIVRKNDGKVLGVKRFENCTDFEVGLLGFVIQNIEIEPLQSPRSVEANQTRAFGVCVDIDGVKSETILVCGSQRNIELHRPLSGLSGVNRMCRRDSMEISLLTNLASRISAVATLKSKRAGVDDCVVTLADNVSGVEGVMIISVSGESFAKQLTSVQQSLDLYNVAEIEVRDNVSGNVVARQTIEFYDASDNVLRLCWVNKTGGVDYYTFPFVKRRVSNIDKSRARTSLGGRITSAVVEKQIVANSEFLCAEIFEQVTVVVSSPRVWMCLEGGEYQLVDILNSQVVYENNQKQRLEIEVKLTVEDHYVI